MKDYISIEELLGVHPNEYIEMLTAQKNFLLNEIIILKKQGALSEEQFTQISKEMTNLFITTLPHLKHPSHPSE